MKNKFGNSVWTVIASALPVVRCGVGERILYRISSSVRPETASFGPKLRFRSFEILKIARYSRWHYDSYAVGFKIAQALLWTKIYHFWVDTSYLIAPLPLKTPAAYPAWYLMIRSGDQTNHCMKWVWEFRLFPVPGKMVWPFPMYSGSPWFP